MNVSAEISYYPLTEEYFTPINQFLDCLKDNRIEVETSTMSTTVSGEYDDVMEILSGSMKELIDKYPSVFTLKISNACISAGRKQLGLHHAKRTGRY